jgi:dihydroorotase
MLVRNAELADGRVRDVRVGGETIDAVDADLSADGEETIDADGRLLLPGMLDVHVHLRQPGHAHKETWATGTRSAAAGGVTTVVDQPNTSPPTVTGDAFDEKAAFAADAVVDYGINGGVTADWDPDALFDRPLFALGEVFLADSTGNMGIDADLFADAAARAADAGVPVTIHAEDDSLFDQSVLPRSTEPASGERERDATEGSVSDERAGGARERSDPRADARERDDAEAWSAYRAAAAEAAAVERAGEVIADTGAQGHVAHASTPEGIAAATEAGLTTEVTPHHLLLSRDDLADLGTDGRMNPPLRSDARREAVYERVADGTVDVIATDHAPHTRAEKEASIWDAPSGVPGVETALPLLLAEAREGRLTCERVRDLTATNPARLFDLPAKGRIEEGRDADLVLVDPEATREIRGADLHTNCEWTPFEGWEGVFPEWTMVRGRVVYRRADDEFPAAVGENVRA